LSPLLPRFLAWLAVGALFMVGCVAPIGFVAWIPAAVLALAAIALGARSMRFFFAFVAGIGAVLLVVGVRDSTYVTMAFLGVFVIAGAGTGFAAFGPRTSHAEPPASPPDPD